MKKFYTIFTFTLLTLQTLITHGTLYSQWYKQSIPVNKPVTGIKFIDTLNGWATIGNLYDPTPQDTGYILHTSNGGTNWLIQFSKISIQFTALAIINNNIGYASGDSINNVAGTAALFKTTNGGLNWFNLPISNNMFVSKFYFLNSDTGWEISDGGGGPDARITTDGGYTWTVRTSGIAATTTSIFFLNYNTGFCGANFNLYKTTNAGVSWVLNNTFSQIITTIFFLNINTGWIGAQVNSLIYFTSNSGINWISQPNPEYTGPTDIYFINSQTGYCGGGISIYLYKTTNGGQLWGFQRDSSGSSKISILDSQNGWIADGLGISHTTNGGGTITYIGIKKISNKLPDKFILYQNYPNPFNSQTNIRFSIMKSSYVEFKIFDEAGKELNPWIFGWQPGKLLEAGTHEFQLNGSDMASGAYFFQLIVTDENSNTIYNKTRKMILLK